MYLFVQDQLSHADNAQFIMSVKLSDFLPVWEEFTGLYLWKNDPVIS